MYHQLYTLSSLWALSRSTPSILDSLTPPEDDQGMLDHEQSRLGHMSIHNEVSTFIIMRFQPLLTGSLSILRPVSCQPLSYMGLCHASRDPLGCLAQKNYVVAWTPINRVHRSLVALTWFILRTLENSFSPLLKDQKQDQLQYPSLSVPCSSQRSSYIQASSDISCQPVSPVNTI